MAGSVPTGFGYHLVDEDGDGDGDAEDGMCARCGTRIRTAIQQGADHCLQCREGSA